MSSPKILLVGNYESDAQYSMAGYADALAGGIVQRGWQASVLKPSVRLYRPSQGRLGKWTAYVDKMVLFPRTLRREGASSDLVHLIDQGNGFYGPVVAQFRHLATIHDLLAIRAAMGEIPGWTVGPTGQRLQKMIQTGLRQMSNFVAISSMTMRDVTRVIKPDPAYLRLIYNGMVAPFRRQSPEEAQGHLAPFGLTPRASFALAVGSTQYKNHAASVKILAGLREQADLAGLRLVIVSRFRDPEATAAIESLGMDGHVMYLQDLPRPALEALYSSAKVLLFPSTNEGFGLPIIEAQSCGCPVVTSDREPMSEVAGTSALLIDPDHPGPSIPLIAEQLANPEPWVAAGHVNVQRFSFERWISDYTETYREILK